MLEILISYFSIIDSIDINHRTPLFLACKKGNILIVKSLLLHKADPSICSNSKKSCIKVAKTPKIAEMLKKVLFINNTLKHLPKKQREDKWKELTEPYFQKLKL